MLGYMHYAKPILASINPGSDLKSILGEHDAGLVFISGRDEALAEGARRLLRNCPLRDHLGRHARLRLEKTFSSTHAATQILPHFTPPGT